MTAEPSHPDLAYADTSPAQVLDLRLGQHSTRPPLIIDVHGGAFRMGDKALERDNIAALLDAGYVAASLDYRLSEEAVFPAAAVAWYGPNDFAAMDDQFRAAPPPSGVTPQLHDPIDSPESQFLGAPVQTSPEVDRHQIGAALDFLRRRLARA